MLLIAFFTACAHDNVPAIQTYLSSGNDVDSRDSDGRTGLHVAASAGAEAAVAFLLQSGADPTTRSYNGRTAFMSAVLAAPSASTRRIASFLLQVTPDRQRETSQLCTLFAALSGQAALDSNVEHGIHLLLSAGAPVDQRDAYGRTALMLALCREAPRAGITRESPSAQYTRAKVAGLPPHLAAVVQDLIARGCNLSAVDREGASALRHAMLADNEPLVQGLLDSGWPISRADCAPLSHIPGAAGVVRAAGARAVEAVTLSPWTLKRLHGGGAYTHSPGEGLRTVPIAAYQQVEADSASELLLDSKGRPILSRLGGSMSSAPARYRYGGFAYCPPYAPHCDDASAISASQSQGAASAAAGGGASDEASGHVLVGLGSSAWEGSQGGDVSSEVAFRELRTKFLSSIPHVSELASADFTSLGQSSRPRHCSSSSASHPAPARSPVHVHNGGLSDDEALAVALRLSCVEGTVSSEAEPHAEGANLSFSYGAGSSGSDACLSARATMGTSGPVAAADTECATFQQPSRNLASIVDAERVWRRRQALILAYYGRCFLGLSSGSEHIYDVTSKMSSQSKTTVASADVAVYTAVTFASVFLIFLIWYLVRACWREDWTFAGVYEAFCGVGRDIDIQGASEVKPADERDNEIGVPKQVQMHSLARVFARSVAPTDIIVRGSMSEPRIVFKKGIADRARCVAPMPQQASFPHAARSTSSTAAGSSVRDHTASTLIPGSIIVVPPEDSPSAIFGPGPRPLPVLVQP